LSGAVAPLDRDCLATWTSSLMVRTVCWGPETRATRCTLRLSIHPGDHGETVATISHPPARIAGGFHLAELPDLRWPATAFDHDTHGNPWPVVTADTLDIVLAAAESHGPIGVDVTPGMDGVRHILGRDGIVVTLGPDRAGHYHLRPLAWSFVCEPHPA